MANQKSGCLATGFQIVSILLLAVVCLFSLLISVVGYVDALSYPRSHMYPTDLILSTVFLLFFFLSLTGIVLLIRKARNTPTPTPVTTVKNHLVLPRQPDIVVECRFCQRRYVNPKSMTCEGCGAELK